ncbi:glycosyl transferase family 90-domain-containing protein [Mycena sp. CBHHK59/15]|nr:glycosyl transferase family 90-domain-containing protein [Mycena sp. CBHHK59/15]
MTLFTAAAVFAPHDIAVLKNTFDPHRHPPPPPHGPFPPLGNPPPPENPPKPQSQQEYIADARASVDALFARQSKTLAQARARYALRSGRPPPRNYDDWFGYAQRHRCLVDDYAQIQRDFAPFYEIARAHPAFFREMVELAATRMLTDSRGMTAISIKDGAVHRPEYLGTYFAGDWEGTFKKFLPHLPDMDVLLNGRDEPRVVFDVLAPGALADAALNATDAMAFAQGPHPTWDFFKDRPGCGVPLAAAGLPAGVPQDVSFLLSASSAEFTTDLYPVLSMAKLFGSCFADIVVPGQFNYRESWWAGKFEHADNVPWAKKKAQLYWRGKSNGGHIHGTNYRSFPRFRLLDLARSSSSHNLLDVALTGFHEGHCTTADCDRDGIVAAYNIGGDTAPREEVYGFKYALDVDGNTFSGRYWGLLRSGSLVFKSTAFNEFFTDWLRPYEHFLPVRPDLADLVAQVEWAVAHDDEARRIQEAGRLFAELVLTDDQNDCYWYAVLLEWGTLWGMARGT